MAKPKSKTGYFVANQGFATTYEGEPLFVQKGELVHKDHPLIKGREDLFDEADRLTRFDRPDVEQATAAPGEKRGRKKRVSTTESEPATEPEAEPEGEPEGGDEQGDDEEAEG